MLARLYNWTIAKASHRHAQWWLFAIAFIESSFFPIPPHPVLGLMCLADPKRALRFAAICTAGSVLGGLFGYAIGHFLYESIGLWLLGALGLTQKFPVAVCYLNQYDAEAIIIAGATPIPFKLMTLTAGFTGMNLATFIGASIVGRGMIFMAVGVLFRLFGAPIKAFIEKYLGMVTTAFVALVIGGFLVLGLLSGDGKKTVDACSGATMESVGMARK
ncbi:MAG: cytochrome B [Alphaproteobacteria bacterium HGW-Alphaproteobacteria-17]|uniref:YqaA family protein n=1 Tax=Sphingopyxis solisilvae TaxID=1886788 RepID=UPI000CBD324A|nr:YqaA family protein [Sphingopyxis solisilvae]PKP87523.1 MAG: cytochrome B [Alphaproteobacteria bacterium HGW-Alphaproteobacteria-17]